MTTDVSKPTSSGSPEAGGASLVAVYDLAVSPLNFDIATFLVAAEIARRNAGAAHIHLVVVPPGESVDYGDLAGMSADNLAWRIRQIILPATVLMPSVRAVSLVESRAAASKLLGGLRAPRYPEYYTVERPIAAYTMAEVEAWAFRGDAIPTLAAPAQARTFVARWLNAFSGGRKPISITFREADNATAKNSNREAWASFLARLDKRLYFPFVIRDTDRVFEPLPPDLEGVAHFPLAAVNIELRAAAYELSHLNLVGMSGPAMLCLFDSTARCLVFNVGTSGSSTVTPNAYRINYGIEPGQQLRHTTPYQRLVWGRDEAETICRHFDLMARFVDGGKAALADGDERNFIFGADESPLIFADRVFVGRQWGPSRTIYRHLLDGEPERPDWIYRLGVAETWSGNPAGGMELLQRALDLGYGGAELYLARCEALLFLDRPDQAAANARYALELDPGNFDAAIRLGLLFETHGRIDDACRWLEQAVSLRPDSREAARYLEMTRARSQRAPT